MICIKCLTESSDFAEGRKQCRPCRNKYKRALRRGEISRQVKRPLSATERPTNYDILWAAGIYEGEGSCAKMGANSTRAMVPQKDSWLIERLVTLFGGTVYMINRRDGATYFHWEIWGPRARGFLMTIYKFLSPRRQAQLRNAL